MGTLEPFSLIDFVRESNRIERIVREPSDEEIVATINFVGKESIKTADLVELVKAYQPNAQLRSQRGLDVMVGNHLPRPGGVEVSILLDHILDRVNRRWDDAYQTHIKYETLHPFTDGNGRSGRALWLWQMGGIEKTPLGFLHSFYYQTLQHSR